MGGRDSGSCFPAAKKKAGGNLRARAVWSGTAIFPPGPQFTPLPPRLDLPPSADAVNRCKLHPWRARSPQTETRRSPPSQQGGKGASRSLSLPSQYTASAQYLAVASPAASSLSLKPPQPTKEAIAAVPLWLKLEGNTAGARRKHLHKAPSMCQALKAHFSPRILPSPFF